MKTLSVLLLSLALTVGTTAGAKPKKKTKTTTTQKVEAVETVKEETPPAEAAAAPMPEAAPVPPPVATPEPAVTPAGAAPAAPVAEEHTTTSDSSHLFGLHVAAGLPHPLSAGLNYVHPSKMFSAELNAGSYSLTTSDVTAKMTNMEVGLRWHPFFGSFYLGALVGQRTLNIEKTQDVSGQSVTGKVDIKSNYLAPHIGWMWGMASSGFFMSMDVGAVNPSGTTVDFSTNHDELSSQQEYKDLEADVRDQGTKLGNTTLPLFTLLKLGWLF